MTTHCTAAIRSLRVCAHINLKQARAAKTASRPRMAAYHLQVAKACRRDANALRATAPRTA